MPFPTSTSQLLLLPPKACARDHCAERTARRTDLDVQRIDSQLLAPGSDVLGCQHGGVGRRLVTISLDLHAARHSADGFAATGITQSVSHPSHHRTETDLPEALPSFYLALSLRRESSAFFPVPSLLCIFLPQICDMDECVVERGEYARDAEHEFTCAAG